MALPILVLSILLYIDFTSGECGNCQANNVACQSLTTFSVCINGTARSNEIIKCPEGRVCTDKPVICVKATDSSYQPSCGKGCEVCNSHDNVFSCSGTSTAVFCFGDKTPFSKAKTICPEGYVCDLSNRAICVKKDSGVVSCERESMATTTVSPTTSRLPRDATTFCRENAMEGTFAAEGDKTCKNYFICKALSNGTKFVGYSYSCNANDFFDPVQGWCTRKRPDGC